MNRREFLQINLAGAAVALTGLPSLIQAESPTVMTVRLFTWDYTPVSATLSAETATTLADMLEMEPRAYTRLPVTRDLREKGYVLRYEFQGCDMVYGWFADLDGTLVQASRFQYGPKMVAPMDQLTLHVDLVSL